MEKPFKVTFPDGSTARAVRVRRPEGLPDALRELDLKGPCPALVLVGGAGGLSDDDAGRLSPLFAEVLAPLAEAAGAAVIDGGTDAGVMRLMGRARAGINATFPLVGVAAAGTVALPDAPPPRPDAATLDPHHTHFVLVPGSDWGDEAPWLVRVASALAGGMPSVTVLVNGGETALEDASLSAESGRPVIVVSGSGRTADTLAGALRGDPAGGKAGELAASGLLRAVDMAAGGTAISGTIEGFLLARG